MDLLQAFWLAVIQGLTEFLPVSSSAHLILLPTLLDWPDQGLAFDVAVHVGTLAAVVLYFRQELKVLTRDWTLSLAKRQTVGDSRLAWAVAVGTIPAGLIGFFLNDLIELYLRSPIIIAWATIGFGLLLWWADHFAKCRTTEYELSWGGVVFIGFAQALALIPGTSRSGITMTAGLMLGMTRVASARFSFLLSIPLIMAAGGLKGKELLESAVPVDWSAIALGIAFSAITAYLCIHFFLQLVERVGMLPFVIYRLVLGVILLWMFS